jgi:trans-aconitate methyltransferase
MSERPPKTEWDAGAYHRLSAPQTRWGQKVIERLPPLRGDETILDVGCGSGKLSAELAELVPRGRVIALDRSEQMIAGARAFLSPKYGERVSFISGDVLDLSLERPVDLIFSTATFHWVLDHRRLFQVLRRALAPGGVLIAQCGGGDNLARIYGRAELLMREPALSRYFDGWKKPVLFSDEASARRNLLDAGFTAIDVGLVEEPTPFADRQTFWDFIESVVFVTHLPRISDPSLARSFIEALVALAAEDHPPFTLDYWRLNLSARAP